LQTYAGPKPRLAAALELAARCSAGSSEPKAFIQRFAGTTTSVVE